MSFNLRKSFVVDRGRNNNAYLVLTIPVNQVKFHMPNLRKIKESVNNAFDAGISIDLNKFSRIASGDRLRRVKERISGRASADYNKEGSPESETVNEAESFEEKFDAFMNKPLIIQENNSLDDLL